ncbi:sigma-54-dependent Fis family transcriptional regulator [Sphingorhabdus soli]|uniref:DNA-binding transcriptional regulator NtrC n=1 Tax=Flavisphingopyxis soli TaxID=2601267 RepID=A0A5C6U8H8_9SPHN|nr:sigma-54 dependent transcriptional regulator [Sphingorhabdus soli]TXC69179.1 sigma-54-dependent Fis family transcriptional regulator [Sphingorhabdus soli]
MSGSPHILLAEDDNAVATVIQASLEGAGYRVALAETRAARDAMLAGAAYDLLITDVVFPDGNGFDTLADALANTDGCSVIVVSAQNTLDTAIRAARLGSYDYLPKPFDLDELLKTTAAAMHREASAAEPAQDPDGGEQLLIGRTPPMQALYRVIARLADNDLAVLIGGESGTGKELVARAIHQSGQRAQRPFVAINMAAIPRDLVESELFGHERGAFTGANARTEGRFGQAEGGTLFLDEIGDMPLDAQTRLLRVLQSGEYSPVGGSEVRRSDVRIIAASHRSLPDLVAEGRFREDLFYRLNVVPVAVPALRERRGDIAGLCRHFMVGAQDRGLPAKTISAAALKLIERQDWPGNVRELENFVYRMCVLARGDTFGVSDVRAQFVTATDESGGDVDGIDGAIAGWLADRAPSATGALYDDLLARIERPLFEYVLGETGGNQLRAAERLGINRNTLRKRLARHDLP